ncbi:serine--tRNA ligase [Luminiphilus sp.]|jgi:seryl-tRNA synthetase|nr:serine--tRNA ligase [Luminiphilus sp.]MDA8797450.1 serine--tRNA ligase [Luminiphilus sp.]MDB3900471.1 serine--tRNA ligase [Luminiphilus sp.]
MLDIKQVRQDPQQIAQALKKKRFEFPVAEFLRLDSERKEADIRSQELLAERKKASKAVGALIAQGKTVDEAKAEVNDALARISSDLDVAVERAKTVQTLLDELLMGTPNVPDAAVPSGLDETDNEEILVWGAPRAMSFDAKDHADLGEALGQLDFEMAGKITGSRFSVLQGPLARLQRALAQFMLDLHTTEHGYVEVYVPFMVNSDSLYGTGQLPKFAEDAFKIEGDSGYYLIPTAEVPVTNMLRDRILEVDELGEEGVKFTAHTPCFRSEAGSYGRDTRGLIRQHQFEKVELVQAVRPDQSDAALETLTSHAEAVLQRLELPYRKVRLCGGDLGFSAAMTYDLEVWLPGQSAYREISSCSNFRDYQSRRMQARWRNPNTGKPELLHTLNGSGLAVGRTLVAVVENGQQADGTIQLPAALVPYFGADTITAT